MSEDFLNIDFSLIKIKDFEEEKPDNENEFDFNDIDISKIICDYGPMCPFLYEEEKKFEKIKKNLFDLSLLKRNELYINLIHFDLRILNNENYDYYKNFKVDVVGGFQAIDDLKMIKKFLEAIKNKNIPFIVFYSIYCNIFRF